ncbi:MAG TPA: 2-oxoacid:acceptor oxidoreductase family protein, partial [bacterium]|nr:2-oxoacid:acceptor oxidoreductase family protein [bacterium]
MATTIERPQVTPLQKVNDLVFRLAGEGGEGVVSTGRMLGDAFVRYNLKIFTFQTFPAEIKGGTVMYQLRANANPIRSRGDVADCFAAFTQEGYDKYAADLPSEGYLLYNSDEVKGVSDRFAATYAIPMLTLARETGESITKTTVGAGAIAGMLHMDLQVFEDLLRKRFASKAKRKVAEMKQKGEWDKHIEKLEADPAFETYRGVLERTKAAGTYGEDLLAPIVQVNITALHLGYNYYRNLEEEQGTIAPFKIEPIPGEQKMVGTGNRMICLGALAAGCRFYAGYPITPASDIMEELATFMPQFGGS